MSESESEPGPVTPLDDAGGTETRSKPSRTLLAIVAALVIAAGVLTVFAFVLNPPGDSNTSTGDAASPSPSESPVASANPSESALPVRIIPEDCAEIYTRDWASELAPLVLNPEWTKDQPDRGTNDDALAQLLEPGIVLRCSWGHPDGGGEVGIVTSLAIVDERNVSLVRSRIDLLGWTCNDELGGVRCYYVKTEEAGSWGESHFFRDGVWIATRWANVGPEGYTADIATTLWQ